MHVRDCSCAIMLRFFSAASDGATTNRQVPNRIFGQFCTSLRKDIVANYASIWMLFSPAVKRTRCALEVTKRFIVILVVGATRFANLLWKSSKT